MVNEVKDLCNQSTKESLSIRCNIMDVGTPSEIPFMLDMTTYDSFFSAIWYTTGAFSMINNITFLFLIVFRSPPSLTPYKLFLGNSAITDIVFSAATTFLQCRLIPNKWAFAYVALGPSRFFGEQVSYYTYVLQLHSLFYIFLCFPLSFGFRYYVLVRPMPTKKQVCLLLFCVWLMPLAQSICFINSQSDSEKIREYLAINKPFYNLTGYIITGNHMLWQPLTPITLFSIVLPMFPIYLIVIHFGRKVQGYLDGRESGGLTLQASTKKGHRRLLQALILQASLPLFFVFPPITIYLAYHFEFIELKVIEYLVYVLFSFLPVFNPLLSIYFVRPYNLAIRGLFHRAIGLPPPEGSVATIAKKSNAASTVSVYDRRPSRTISTILPSSMIVTQKQRKLTII